MQEEIAQKQGFAFGKTLFLRFFFALRAADDRVGDPLVGERIFFALRAADDED